MFGCDCCCISSLVYFVGLFAIASKVFSFLRNKFKAEKHAELVEKNYEKDVVYLYQFRGTPTASSISPFCIKVEAFCRLHCIKFKRCNSLSARGQNDRLPFIELNGEQHADSQIILRRLTQIFKLKAYPDAESAAIGHAVDRLIDNHTCLIMCMGSLSMSHTFVEAMLTGTVPALFLPIISRLGGLMMVKMKGDRAMTAVGKFTESECEELLRNDLAQLQTILGKNKFLVGDEPTAVDCTAFGQFGASYYAIPSARCYLHDLLESSDFVPLRKYIERVRSRIFGSEFFDKN